MKAISSNPILYEINTFVWLRELSRKYQQKVVLGTVPLEEWARLAQMGIQLVWLMGVWQRSPAAIDLVRHNPVAIEEFRQELPGFTFADLTGSPYSVRSYLVDPAIGGDTGLAIERTKLAGLGLGLILDYVPNHVAPDHPWTQDHPDYFIQGEPQDLIDDPESFIQLGKHIFARGRDPNFPAWMDVVQLNAFDPGLRQATANTLRSIASRCDGMRVDMAMLLINRIFASTWGSTAGEYPPDEFWPPILAQVKSQYPRVSFIAEAYWDTEEELIEYGFDYCYDKKLYDHLRDGHPRRLSAHLRQVERYQTHLVRFIENHDEPRALTAFLIDDGRLAALATATLPGLRMFHDGQFEGRRTRVSVLLGRRPEEAPDESVTAFYRDLLALCSSVPLQSGHWSRLALYPPTGARPLTRCLAWQWQHPDGTRVIAINLSKQTVSVCLHPEIDPDVEGVTLLDTNRGDFIPLETIPGNLPRFRFELLPHSGSVFDLTRQE